MFFSKTKRRVASLMALLLALLSFTSCAQNPLITPPESPVFSQKRVVKKEKYLGKGYDEFYGVAEDVAVIPGLSEGFIPQGMDYSEEHGILFISGYFKSKTESRASVIFALDAENGSFLGEYWLKKPDGSYLTGHVGGLAVTKKNIFIADGGLLYRFPLSDVAAADGSEELQAAETVKTPTSASYCNYSDGILYVGDFYLSPNYNTPEWRHLTDQNGKKYGAWCAAYKLTRWTESEFTKEALEGEKYAIPDFIFATETKVQGFTVIGDTVVLSRSHGRVNNSALAFYDRPDTKKPDRTVLLEGKEIPTYFLSSERLQKTITAPPMTEGVCTGKNGLYLLFESPASYYKNDGGVNPVDRVYFITIEEE